MVKLHHLLILIVLPLLFQSFKLFAAGDDPTNGFTLVPLTEANFELQKPYDVPLDQRYSFENGVHKMWVYGNDKPHNPTSHTQPRTEIRLTGLEYKTGIWQFQGYGFVPNGTSGATVMQIHGAAQGNTTLILRIYDGNLRYYSSDLVETNMYERWFRLNVIHDIDGGSTVMVFIDAVKKYVGPSRGPGDLYFKCGVYAAPHDISYYMESRWRDIKVFNKNQNATQPS